jgi:hypothetical protein
VKAISIQVQPHRAPGLGIDGVRKTMEHVAATSPLVERHHFDEGHDKGHYFNFTFGTRNLKALWKLLHEQLYADPAHGHLVARSSIATCEGPHGWDDYLLLHHFDPEQRCDVL